MLGVWGWQMKRTINNWTWNNNKWITITITGGSNFAYPLDCDYDYNELQIMIDWSEIAAKAIKLRKIITKCIHCWLLLFEAQTNSKMEENREENWWKSANSIKIKQTQRQVDAGKICWPIVLSNAFNIKENCCQISEIMKDFPSSLLSSSCGQQITSS